MSSAASAIDADWIATINSKTLFIAPPVVSISPRMSILSHLAAPSPNGFTEIVSDHLRSRPLMNWSVQHCVVSTGRNVRGHAADRLLRNHATPDRFHARIARFVAGEILLISRIKQDV